MSYKKETSMVLRFLIILALLTGSVVAASTPYPIFGKITIDGSAAHGLQIQIENLRTSEVLNIFTTGGEFVTDRSRFEIPTQSVDDYEVRYCVSDSRCNQETLMFATSGYRKDLSRDLTYINNVISTPYPVYGRLTFDGSAIQNVDIVLENLNKIYSKSLETNSLGEYNYDIANLGPYDIGDIIKLTYGSYETSFTILSFNTPGHELNLAIVTPVDNPPNNGGDNDKPDIIIDDGCDPVNDPTCPDYVEPKDDPVIEPEPTPNPEPNPTPEPNPEPIKGGLGLLIFIIVLIVIGGGYMLYKKYKR